MNFGAGINRFGETQFIDAIIEQHGIFFIAIYKQSRCCTDDEITMCYLLLEHCSGKIGGLDMRIKMVAAQIGKVKLGQAARIYIDSNPSQPVNAYVSRIDPQATFTPENTYFRDDRVKQVVGVKLRLKSAIGYAKPGMPADGEILVQGNEWPAHRTNK